MSATAYRRPGAEARRVRTLAFNKLPSAVRERLVGSLVRGGVPAPLLVDIARHQPLSAARWCLLGVVAGIVELGLWLVGFGDPRSDLALRPLHWAAAHGVTIFAVLFAVLRAVRIARGLPRAPFPDGRYLLALDLVEVDDRNLRVTELRTLRRAERRPGKRRSSLVLVFSDRHEVVFERFPHDDALAASLSAQIIAAGALLLPDDQAHLERLDPFFELTISDDWASAEVGVNEPQSLLVRSPLARLAAVLFAASAVIGLGVHQLRNRLSDDAMFTRAIEIHKDLGPAASWHVGDYKGTRHAEEIDAIRFERARGNLAALRSYRSDGGARISEANSAIFELVKGDANELLVERELGAMSPYLVERGLLWLVKGDPVALARYLEEHNRYIDFADDLLFALVRGSDQSKLYWLYLKNGKRHAEEVRRTLLPRAAYREATRGHDVALLSSFVREYPESEHIEEVKALIHSYYIDALGAYRDKQPSAASLRFVTALFADLEGRGDPSVSVTVRLNDTASISAADTALAARHGAEYVAAAPSLNRLELEVIEKQLRGALDAWITSSFANGTVTPRDARPGGAAYRPLITLDCETVAVPNAISPREQVEVADIRLHFTFRAVISPDGQALSWQDTTPGLIAADGTAAPRGAAYAALDRLELGRSTYARMMIVAMPQIIARIRRDL